MFALSSTCLTWLHCSNLALYLSMDVVDASFSQLRSAILSAADFSAADAAHRQFVDSLVSQVGCCAAVWHACH